MIKNTRVRRSAAMALLLLGGALLFLAPAAWPGAILLGLGILLEIVGIALERGDRT